ncbi:hypothetical protein M5K25_014098 [Dendrobium thyrsiflorum]|uniref:Uncharacterized protein n=1 Tax=Dendrobium thyrsiflorum TaxID=117978 RepID=A0ABD0UV75_DENTH
MDGLDFAGPRSEYLFKPCGRINPQKDGIQTVNHGKQNTNILHNSSAPCEFTSLLPQSTRRNHGKCYLDLPLQERDAGKLSKLPWRVVELLRAIGE